MREYQLNTRDKTKDALILDQIVPSTEIRAVSGAGEDPTHENVEDPRDVKIVSSIAHFHRAAELLCDIKSKLKAEKEYFAMHAEESTSQSLLTCSIPDDTLTSLVALSYMALAGVEMSLSNIMFVDGLHLQHGEIMKEILSVLHQSDQESANDENSFHSHDKTERVDKFRGKRKHSSKSGAKFPHATDKNDPYAAIDVFHKHHRPTLPTIMKSKQNPTLRQLDSSGTVIGARSAVAVNSSPDAHLIMDTSSPAPFISEFMGTDYHLGRGLRADGSGARAVKELLANDAVDATGLAHTMKSSSASPSPSRSYSCDTTTELDAELSAEVYAHGHGSNKITKDMYPYIRHFQAGHNKEHYNNTMLLNQQRHFDIMKSVLALLDYSFVLMQDALAYNGPNGIAHSKRLADVAPSVPSSARESKFLFPDSVLDPGSTAPPSVAPSGGSTPSVVTPIRSMGGNSLSTPKRSSIVGRNKKGLPPIPINIDTTISEYVVENHRVLLAILTNKFDEACTHVAHMLKKKFGHVVPGRLGEKKKIAITANHGCRTQAASATFSSVVAANVKEHDQKLNSNATVNASMTVASTTLKEYHDLYEQVSVRSEIFPIGTLIENAIENDEEEDGNNSKEPIVNYTFSVDEFSYWLQWGLLITDVPGYGYMTFSCHQQLENLGHLNQDIIKEVFSNLARLYNELKADISHKSVMYGCIYNSCHKLTHVEDEYDINHRNSNLGLKIVFVSALCKLSAYLENYSDLAMYISEYTALSEILNDYTHLALSHRYQLDFEEFDFQSENQHMGNENRRTMPELTKSLKIAKKYVHYSGYTNDFHLKRDALKKLMNMYLEIYSIADTIKGKHNHTLSSRANHLHMKDSANEAIMEELSNLSIEAVDAKEIADPNWLMKVSKMRAKVIMHRIKELSSVCS